jgi:hypothetical protein
LVRNFNNAKFWFVSLKSFFIILDITVSIINKIWNNFSINPNTQVIPLRLFIQEILRHSKTSWFTLKTALIYLMRIKSQINQIKKLNRTDPAICGRRMFLASLIIASKYLQDRTYANNAWSRICGLAVQEINDIERRFLNLIDYNLFIREDVYKNFII